MTIAAFIGLGVMGEPMCRNLTKKNDTVGLSEVRAFDVRADAHVAFEFDGHWISPATAEAMHTSISASAGS